MNGNALRYAGLLSAPLAWAISAQLGQITPYLDCSHGISWSGWLVAVLLVIFVAGALHGRSLTTNANRTGRFVVELAFLLALASIFALVLQGAAAVLLDPCQR